MYHIYLDTICRNQHLGKFISRHNALESIRDFLRDYLHVKGFTEIPYDKNKEYFVVISKNYTHTLYYKSHGILYSSPKYAVFSIGLIYEKPPRFENTNTSVLYDLHKAHTDGKFVASSPEISYLVAIKKVVTELNSPKPVEDQCEPISEWGTVEDVHISEC